MGLIAAFMFAVACCCVSTCVAIRDEGSSSRIHRHNSGQKQQQRIAISAVRGSDGKLTVQPQGHADALAEAVFVDGAHTKSNMGHLEVWTWPVEGDEAQLYAAGYVEGWATADQIWQHFNNMWKFYNLTQEPSGPWAWLQTQHKWLRGQLTLSTTQGQPFWDAARLLHHQLDGMHQGYNDRVMELQQHTLSTTASASTPKPLTADQFYFLCSLGDLGDITAAIAWQQSKPQVKGTGTADAGPVPVAGQPDWDGMSAVDVAAELATGDRCSALVKVSPDLTQIWVGQVAWFTYSAMLRVFKHYDFALTNPSIPGNSMGFSSYYGQLSSDDDFYLVGNLAILQTTNRIMNKSLLDHIQPTSMLSWQRVRIANAIASDGSSWAEAVQTHNSGTYTNTWLVIHLGMFHPGQALSPGLLTVVEQIPGHVWWEDRTQQLESGYMAMFNVPVLKQTYEALGYPDFVNHMSSRGPAYEQAVSGALWQLAPRAKIFRRDHVQVTDITSMQQLMRSNDWKNDAFSLNSSLNAICGRGDLNPGAPRPAGCYDGKVSDLTLGLSLRAKVINGPPATHDMTPFDWRTSNYADTVSHIGQAQRFDFQWEEMGPDNTHESRQARTAAH